MSSPLTPSTPSHILAILERLHKQAIDQEKSFVQGSGTARFIAIPTDGDDKPKEGAQVVGYTHPDFDALMQDKFIAMDEEKDHYAYQLICALGATNVVEAGTSMGVSTIYLALAVAKNKAALGKTGKVIATEKELMKAERARAHWKECGPLVEDEIELRVGDLLETLKEDIPVLDLLLLDVWSPLSLPTLKLLEPSFRPGTVVLTDNTVSSALGYKNLLAYVRDPVNGYQSMPIPFPDGLEMSIYRHGA